MIRYRVDVRTLALDREDLPAFIEMMKHIEIPHTVGSTGSKYAMIAVYIQDVDKIKAAWEARGFTWSSETRQ